MKNPKARQMPPAADVAAIEADDREVKRITRQIMVEYRETLEALAKSEAEDRVKADKADSQ